HIGEQNHGRYANADADPGPNRQAQLVCHSGLSGYDQSNSGNDGAGGVVEDRRLQALLLATAMEEAAPGDERGPDGKRATERPQEEPRGNRAKNTNANRKSCIRGHSTPLWCKSGQMRRECRRSTGSMIGSSYSCQVDSAPRES